MSAGMALDINRHRQAGNVTGQKPDMDRQGSGSPSQSLGADSQLIDQT